MQSAACGTQTYFVYVKLRKLCPAAKGPLTAAENYLRVYLKEKVELGKITKVTIEQPFLDGAIAKIKGE